MSHLDRTPATSLNQQSNNQTTKQPNNKTIKQPNNQQPNNQTASANNQTTKQPNNQTAQALSKQRLVLILWGGVGYWGIGSAYWVWHSFGFLADVIPFKTSSN
jgi:hypothetical protein